MELDIRSSGRPGVGKRARVPSGNVKVTSTAARWNGDRLGRGRQAEKALVQVQVWTKATSVMEVHGLAEEGLQILKAKFTPHLPGDALHISLQGLTVAAGCLCQLYPLSFH